MNSTTENPHRIIPKVFAGIYNIGVIDPKNYKNIQFLYNPGCNQSMSSIVGTGQFRAYAYPLKWLPTPIKTVKQLLRIFNFFEGLGVSFEFTALDKPNTYLTAVIDSINGSVLYDIRTSGKTKLTPLTDSNKWVYFYLKSPGAPKYNYYAHCLIRCLFSSPRSLLITDAMRLSDEHNISPFEAFQIAHYAYPLGYNGTGCFFPSGYGGMQLLDLQDFLNYFKGDCSGMTLNGAFGRRQLKTYTEIHTLYKEGKFDEIREILR